jgi:hypothetical protein
MPHPQNCGFGRENVIIRLEKLLFKAIYDGLWKIGNGILPFRLDRLIVTATSRFWKDIFGASQPIKFKFSSNGG